MLDATLRLFVFGGQLGCSLQTSYDNINHYINDVTHASQSTVDLSFQASIQPQLYRIVSTYYITNSGMHQELEDMKIDCFAHKICLLFKGIT